MKGNGSLVIISCSRLGNLSGTSVQKIQVWGLAWPKNCYHLLSRNHIFFFYQLNLGQSDIQIKFCICVLHSSSTALFQLNYHWYFLNKGKHKSTYFEIVQWHRFSLFRFIFLRNVLIDFNSYLFPIFVQSEHPNHSRRHVVTVYKSNNEMLLDCVDDGWWPFCWSSF